MFSVHHISLSVKDIDRSIKFYNQLEFAEVHRWKSPNGDLEISHLKVNDIFLELFCFKVHQDAPSTTMSLEKDLPRIGVKHFGLKVKSIEEIKKILIEKGIANNIEIKRGRTNIDYFFIKDPDDIFIEIVQDDRGL
jgi:glyoxylase I family protein